MDTFAETGNREIHTKFTRNLKANICIYIFFIGKPSTLYYTLNHMLAVFAIVFSATDEPVSGN